MTNSLSDKQFCVSVPPRAEPPTAWLRLWLFQVLMKDITTPVPPEEMKKVVQKSLEKAARINYGQLIDYAQIKGDAFIFEPFPSAQFSECLISHQSVMFIRTWRVYPLRSRIPMWFNHQLRFVGNVVTIEWMFGCCVSDLQWTLRRLRRNGWRTWCDWESSASRSCSRMTNITRRYFNHLSL